MLFLAVRVSRPYNNSMKIFLYLLAFALLLPVAAFAQDVGRLELQTIVNLFGSPLGKAVGLGVTAIGVWQFVVSQNISRGLILIVLGVVVTAFPAVFNGLRQDFYDVPASMGGSGEAGAFGGYVGN